MTTEKCHSVCLLDHDIILSSPKNRLCLIRRGGRGSKLIMTMSSNILFFFLLNSLINKWKENGWKTGSDAVSEVSVGEKYEKLQDDAIAELELPFNLNNFRTKITATELLNEGFKFEETFNEKISPLLVFEQGKTKLYLGFDNFRVITKYNRSSKYALAVHQLALEISKRFDE